MADYVRDCTHPDHTHGPIGYAAWHEWAELKWAEGYAQKRCPGCGRLAKWVREYGVPLVASEREVIPVTRSTEDDR